MTGVYDVIIIGGGQSGLACAYYLRRTKLNYLILDNQDKCGGSWIRTWDSLHLFSPAQHSSLPGWLMPQTTNRFPSRDQVIDYLCRYEDRYQFPVKRPVNVAKVEKDAGIFELNTSEGNFFTKTIISATGTWQRPFIPNIEGEERFRGEKLHAAYYKNSDRFLGKKVLIIGEGNSGAQILAEVSKVTKTSWATLTAPSFLPDDVDGKELFDVATAKYKAEKEGKKFNASRYNLGAIVMVSTVKEAKERGVLKSQGSIMAFTNSGVVWENGRKEDFEVVIFCTGFCFATEHLKNICKPDKTGKIKTRQTQAIDCEGLWLVGYGGWTGYASATLIGVGRSAKKTVKAIEKFLA